MADTHSSATICAMLCLSTKYDVPTLRKDVLQILAKTFPMKIVEWCTTYSPPNFHLKAINDSDTNLWTFSKIARELDLTWLLPGIYYRICCRLMFEYINFCIAEVDDAVDVAAGWVALVGDLSNTLFQWTNPVKNRCRDVLCVQARFDFFQDKLLDVRDRPYDLDLSRIGAEGTFAMDLTTSCPHCSLHKAKLVAEGRLLFWQRLPGYFGLPPWAELEKLKDSSFSS